MGVSCLFISHDMAVVEQISHRVAVMYAGRFVETGTRAQVFENPQHDYTRRLFVANEGDLPSPVKSLDYVAPHLEHVALGDGHSVWRLRLLYRGSSRRSSISDAHRTGAKG
jgi:peptide/nickel transport system ATP-binding protein